MKLEQRLWMTFVALTATVLLVTFAVISVVSRRDAERELDDVLRVEATELAELASEVGHAPERELRSLGADPPQASRAWAAAWSGDGKLDWSTADWPAGALDGLRPSAVPAAPVYRDLPGNLRAVVVPLGDRGALAYALRREFIEQDERDLWRVFAWLFGTGMLAAFVVARWLGRRLARDLGTVADVARAVTLGDMKARVGDRAHDSLEAKSLAGDLDRMIDRLDALLVAQRAFVSNAAHELRSPLAALRGELELAVRRERTAEEYRAAIETALGDVATLVALAEDLLTLARLQGSSGTPTKDPLPIGAILEEAKRMARGVAEAREVRIETEDATAGARVLGSRMDLTRALRNLLDNAAVHSPRGGVVTVRARAQGDRVRIEVQDQGPGVPESNREAIFTAFFRGEHERADTSGGAGIGLAITREIVRAHGGDVRIDAEHVGGSRFVLELPRT
jgi:two-component system heavy metal sensor histidine kinase CusS